MSEAIGSIQTSGLGDKPEPRSSEWKRCTGTGVSPGQPWVHRAFGMAETLFAVVLVGGLVVVSLNTVGAATVLQHKMDDLGRGQLLASELMTEILQQFYEEPVDPPTFGRDPGEGNGSRSNFDDVDDYHGWNASPPEYKNGTTMSNLTGWSRSVTVHYVDPGDLPSAVGNMNLGVKRITVKVSYQNRPVSTLVAVRTGTPGALRIGLQIDVPQIQ